MSESIVVFTPLPPTATQADVYSYDAENRLSEAKRNGGSIATFTYDDDGAIVKGTVNGVTTIYLGNYYEVSGRGVRKEIRRAPPPVVMVAVAEM